MLLPSSFAATPPPHCLPVPCLPLACPPPADNKQQKLYAEYAQQQSQRKIVRTQEQCRKKLQEVHNGYLAAKRKYQVSGGAPPTAGASWSEAAAARGTWLRWVVAGDWCAAGLPAMWQQAPHCAAVPPACCLPPCAPPGMPRPFSHCCPWLQEVLAQKHGLQNDNQELQDKYNQKAMWVLLAGLPACATSAGRCLPEAGAGCSWWLASQPDGRDAPAAWLFA